MIHAKNAYDHHEVRTDLIIFFFLCFLVFSDGAGSKGDVKGRWRPTHRTRCGRKIYIGGTGPVRRRHRPRHDTGEYSFVLFTVHGYLFIQMLWEFNPMYDRQGKLKKRIALVGQLTLTKNPNCITEGWQIYVCTGWDDWQHRGSRRGCERWGVERKQKSVISQKEATIRTKSGCTNEKR